MNINRHNYEEYFLLYIDNELSPADRAAVEGFVQENPDLAWELETLRDTLQQPDTLAVFADKSVLFRSGNPVTAENCEEYFLLYADNELTLVQKQQVEQFVYDNPRYQQDFELFQQAVLVPESTVRFPDKSSLYRSEKDERVVVIRWWRYAAAAAVLLVLGTLALYYNGRPDAVNNGLASGQKGNAEKNTPGTADTQKMIIPAPDSDNNTLAEQKNLSVDATGNNVQYTASTPGNKNEKKLPVTSNIPEPSPVTLQKELIAMDNSGTQKNEVIGTGLTAMNLNKNPETIVAIDQAVDPDELSSNDNPDAYYASATDNQIEVLNTTVSKKNKMRGFFRKVSRVVEKTTSIGPGENENGRGLRIANFEIALK